VLEELCNLIESIGYVMSVCKKIRRVNKQVCIGALKDSIILQTRRQNAPIKGSVDHTISFVSPVTANALVETKKGIETFDGTNINALLTHHFTIRFLANIEVFKFVEFRSKYFLIDRTVNIDEKNQYLILMCSDRGDTSKQVNFS